MTFIHPQFDPVALQLGPLAIRWYALSYLAAFGLFWLLSNHRAKGDPRWSPQVLSDLLFFGAMGVVIGGRLGYVLFYNFGQMLDDPLMLFRVWEGGMSFHGGVLGVMFGIFLFARSRKRPFLYVLDFVAAIVPIGLGMGRIGNFINAELVGRPTDLPWAVVFPNFDNLSRHPSQLYQAFLEGVLLFALVWFFSRKPRPMMAVSGLFAAGYGLQRFVVEFFRQPDPHLGFVAGEWLTMGQLLSIPLLCLGVGMIAWAYRRGEVAQ